LKQYKLRVRELIFSDIEAFHTMQSDIRVMQFITEKAATYDESVAKLVKFIKRYKTKEMEWPFAIESKETSNFMGICGIIEENEIGYRFTPNYWKQGFGTEILEGLIVFAKSLGLKNLMAEVIVENIGSFKILQNTGFKITDKKTCSNTQLSEYKMFLKL